MEIFKILFVFILLEASSSLPQNPNHRWSIQRDDLDNFHVIDLQPIQLDPEPAFDAMQDVFFMLFTRSNPIVGQRIGFDILSVLNSNFNPALNVRILIHGWLGSHTVQENPRTTADFLRRGDFNVIVVDWSAGSQALYSTARWRVRDVGIAIARYIDWLYQNGFTQFSRVNLIGHSLGSHVAGHAGKAVVFGRVNAIFATDPASDQFEYNDPDNRLAADDAFYTEAIVTNTGLPFDAPIAHANFYPNYGATQPGCTLWTCHHHRATIFYGESLNTNLFLARQCANKDEIFAENCPGIGGSRVMMGGDDAKTLRGVFFLETRDSSPFALG